MVKDHLGKEFKNEKEMCDFWNVLQSTFIHRRLIGWTLEKSLTGKEKVKDHLGKEFRSEKEMYEYWGVESSTYHSRKRAGLSVETCLTGREFITDHLGNKYRSKREMLQAYGITYKCYNSRKRKGWSLEKILTYKNYTILSHPITNELMSIYDLSKLHNIEKYKVHDRLSKNITLLRALDISPFIRSDAIQINISKYNLTIVKRITKGKDVFECYITNDDESQTFKIMSYDMIDKYCIDMYKKEHNIL